MMLMEFSITPLDKGASVSPYVARCVQVVEQSGLEHRLNPMGTVVEGSTPAVLAVVAACFSALEVDCKRITCTAKFDHRPGDQSRLESKIASVETHLGHSVSK